MRARWLTILLSLLAVLFGSLAVRIALRKHFTLDEFQYAHAAWLVAHGQIPYRDFFDDRFPLLFQILGLLPPLHNARPQDLVLLRWAVLPVVLLIAALIALLNRSRGSVVALLGVVFLLAIPAFIARATEIRPDALAFMLFLAAIALLSARDVRDSTAALLAGLLLAASVWASLKVVSYGCIFAIALLLPRRKTHLRNPALFIAGFGAFAAVVALYLAMSGSASDWFLWSVRWAWVHEREYPQFPRFTTAMPFVRESWWLVALCLAGWVQEIREKEPDLLLLLALPSAFLSFAAQRAPFEYSLIPFIGIAAVFAARGVAALMSARRIVAASVIVVCAAGAASAAVRIFEIAAPSNAAQLETLRQLDAATAPADAVYDNTGAYFARPGAWYFFYTDEVLRRRLGPTMTADVENALRRSQAPAILIDLRFRGLPPQLQRFLFEHYQPYSGDIRLWGMHFAGAAGEFIAIQSGRYFVDPPTPISIDGRPARGPIFSLTAGPHSVNGPRPFSILWLPRDGKRYSPGVTPAQSVFSFL